MARGLELGDDFPRDFEHARRAFVEAATDAGAAIETFAHHLSGPAGETLSTDVALLGNPAAKNVLMLVSGTHGVEGLPGSGLMVSQLRTRVCVPDRDDLAVMLVHALNPIGLANRRRVDEDNVDVNRNFAALPTSLDNPDYDALHPLLTMSPSGLGSARRHAALATYVARKGRRALQRAVTRGQFAHQTGLFFGGHGPSWSHRTWARIVDRLSDKRRVLVIDYHTGLGPHGRGELISPLRSQLAREHQSWQALAMAACFGIDAVRLVANDDAVATEVSGDLLSYTMQRGDHMAGVALEFGTYPPLQVLDALINENWAHHADDPRVHRYRDQLVEVFSPDERAWRRSVCEQAAAVTTAAIRGLTRSA